MELFKLLGTIAIDNSGANDAIDDTTGKAEASESRMTAAFKKIGTAVVTYLAVDKIISFGETCLEAAANVQATNSQFTQVFGDFEESAASSLSAIADSAGISENRMKSSFTKIAAFAKTTGMETEDALALSERAMIAVADSAAFYDRSLEETTESLQSFLKGNYENDSALGLSCTEVTRNAKANELYGESFANLTEQQKQLTLLAMVEDANALSGAIGQASRESDTWSNQTGNLSQSFIDLKAKIGSYLLEPMIEVVKVVADVVEAFTNNLDPAIEFAKEIFGQLHTAVSNAINTIIIPAIQTFIDIVGQLWLQNQDKVTLIIERFNAIKDTVSMVINDIIIPAIQTFINFIGQLWVENQDKIMLIINKFNELQQLINDVINNFIIPAIQSFIQMIADLLAENQDKLQKIQELFGAIFDWIADKVSWFVDIAKNYIYPFLAELYGVFQQNLDNIKLIFQKVLDAIGGIIDFFISLFKGDWDGMFEAIKTTASSVWDAVTGIFKTAWQVIQDIFALETVQEFFSAVLSTIEDIFGGIADWFGDIFATAWNKVREVFSAGGEIFTGITTGIADFFKTIVNGLIGGINDIISVPFNAINDMLSGIKSVNIMGAKPFDWITTFSVPAIPYLEEGGVLEKGQVGLLEGNGAEAVVPLEQNTGWLNEIAARLNGLTGADAIEMLRAILEELRELNAELVDKFIEALERMSFKIDKREFARLVEGV